MKDIEIHNNNIIIADDIKYCDDIFSRTKGLMFRRPLKQGQAILLEANEESILETTIHMLFVFFPIDVVWLNKDKKVVYKKANVKIFTPILAPKEPAKYVLELPKGSAKHIQVGDTLKFEEK